MSDASATLTDAACDVLRTADPAAKAAAARALAARWRAGSLTETGDGVPPRRPSRPDRPELRAPRDMPKRRKAGALHSRIALLHAVAHIELNAIDLAWDLIGRFTAQAWPAEFHADWLGVAEDEARHFAMLQARLTDLGARYGDLPAHDGLWRAALDTAHDPLARLAVVPLVLEARGLDVTPGMIKRLDAAGDKDSVAILRIVLADEITHVAAGRRWFSHLAEARGLDPATAFQDLVRRHPGGRIKPPFNRADRHTAGLPPGWYEPLVDP